jgi:hypothetical protein
MNKIVKGMEPELSYFFKKRDGIYVTTYTALPDRTLQKIEAQYKINCSGQFQDKYRDGRKDSCQPLIHVFIIKCISPQRAPV